MAKVFISHSWDDNAISRQLAEYLRRDGAEVWIDYARIQGGDSLPKIISEAIDWCDTLILIWSKSANASFWVGEEWTCAYSLQKRIIPCVTDQAILPSILRSKLYLDFSDFDRGYQDLARTLKLSIKRPKIEPVYQEVPPTPKTDDSKLESTYDGNEIKDSTSFKLTQTSKKKSLPKLVAAVSIFFVLVVAGYLAINHWPNLFFSNTLSQADVKKILKDNDFFSKEYDWNKEFCNPSGKGYPNDFVLQKNDLVVYDRKSGLMWQQSGSKESLTYEAAEQYIAELNRNRFAGLDGWRLPTLEEAMSLMEPEKNKDGLYINSMFDKTQQWIWTSNFYQGASRAAWVVYFDYGDCFYDFWDGASYVRAVRPGQSSP